MYHEQLGAVYKKDVKLNNIAPELITIERISMGASLNLPLQELQKKAADQKAIEAKIMK